MYNEELKHYGILGMHWGIRRFQNKNGTLTAEGKERYNKDRKTGLFESVNRKKNHVEEMRKQAGERIKFYGGKNAALNAIEQEASYKKKVTTAKTAAVGSALTVGALYAASAGALSTPVGLVSAGAVAAGSAMIGKYKKYQISSLAKEQIMYTKDSDYGADKIVKKVRD